MLPASYQLPAAILLLVGGLLACFFGYRLFRVVLGIYGFILGALVATSIAGNLEPGWMILVALGGGVVGAVILILAYFIGVALVGASLGALLANVVWEQFGREPNALAVILFAVAGALGAIALQRLVIIVGTAFGGAWTALVGALVLVGDRVGARAAEARDVWLAYPTNPAPGQRWVMIAALVLGCIGTAVQLGVTARGRK